VAPPAPPSVYAFASPSYLMGPGFTSIYANYANATYCMGMGSYYVSFSTSFMVTCSGPGGNASSFAWVTVQQSMAAGNFASMSTASKDVKPAAAKPIRAPASLKHLGIDLSKKRYAYVEGDLNRDGAMDLIVLDKAQQKVFVLLAKGAQSPAISKTVSNITTLTQIKGVFVPISNAPGEIRVTVENQQ
jgi:hypothetical protein